VSPDSVQSALFHGLVGVFQRFALQKAKCVDALPGAHRAARGVWVQGLGFRVQGSGCRVQVLIALHEGFGFRVWGSGFRVQDVRFRCSSRCTRGLGSRV
jgi:hypothetical protein